MVFNYYGVNIEHKTSLYHFMDFSEFGNSLKNILLNIMTHYDVFKDVS